MTVHIALLRAVNVGGNNKIAMADLKAMLAAMGFADPCTLLQSGNAVFRSAGKSDAALERRLEAEFEKRFKLKTAFFVRSAGEWATIVAKNPFHSEAEKDPARLHMMTLKDVPAKGAVAALQAAIEGRETVRGHGHEAYLYYPDGAGNRSPRR